MWFDCFHSLWNDDDEKAPWAEIFQKSIQIAWVLLMIVHRKKMIPFIWAAQLQPFNWLKIVNYNE